MLNFKNILLQTLFGILNFQKCFAEAHENQDEFLSLSANNLILTDTHPAYEKAKEPFNITESILSKNPSHIIFCCTVEDVISAVQWTQRRGSEISIRSGGHSYEGFSLCNGIVLDLSRMNAIELSEDKKTVKLQPGCRMINIYNELWKEKRTIVGGSCGTVGIGGFTLGGGFGFLSRMYGLAVDNLVEFEIIDADGNHSIVNSNCHPDLFWACRGAGAGNFGVVTSFTFATHPIENVLVYKISWDWNQFFNVVRSWQHWGPEAPKNLTSVLVIPIRNQGNIVSKGVFLGQKSEFLPYLNTLSPDSPPIEIDVQTISWMDAVCRFDLSCEEKKKPFKAKSDYVEKLLDEDALQTLYQNLSITDPQISCGVVIFDSYGGAINQISSEATAFSHRGQTKFSIQYLTYWNKGEAKEAEISLQWIRNFYQQMRPYVSGFAYQNYCDLDISNWMEAYYDVNQDRLIEIKKKYDPSSFFKSPQGILPYCKEK